MWFTPSRAATSGDSGLIEHEKANNKLLIAIREDPSLCTLLLCAADQTSEMEKNEDLHAHLLLPQSVTLEDVHVTHEFVQTHVVMMQFTERSQARPRLFRSLNGLCGTCHPDDTVTIHGRLSETASIRRIAGVGGWHCGTGVIPQLESQIHILRESTLQPSAQIALAAPIPLLLISDPLFFPGCGWKLPLALRKCTYGFSDVQLEDLHLSDLPQLLFEYQVMGRAYLELKGRNWHTIDGQPAVSQGTAMPTTTPTHTPPSSSSASLMAGVDKRVNEPSAALLQAASSAAPTSPQLAVPPGTLQLTDCVANHVTTPLSSSQRDCSTAEAPTVSDTPVVGAACMLQISESFSASPLRPLPEDSELEASSPTARLLPNGCNFDIHTCARTH